MVSFQKEALSTLLDRVLKLCQKRPMDLSERQQRILKLIIQEYIEHGSPIGSKKLVEQSGLGVSSATVRNEMARLEELGYLDHPHTSAGRMPTEKGYRYFVERLMHETELSPAEKLMIEHQFHQARLDLDQWMRLSAAVLAHTTQVASLVTTPKVSSCQLKHLELVSINDHTALLILVLKEGTLKQQILSLETPHSQESLRSLSQQLTHLWAGCSVREIQATTSPLSGLALTVGNTIADIMSHINARKSSEMYHDGLLHIMEEIDLSEGRVLQQVVRVLEERYIVEQLVGYALREGGVQIIIGGEGRWNNLSHISVILSRYGTEDGVSGALGIVGPIRMPYARAVSSVRFMSRLMSDLMIDLYHR